jgi:hypothetical protein
MVKQLATPIAFFCFTFFLSASVVRADSVLDSIRNKEPILNALWAEIYFEGVIEPEPEEYYNGVAFVDLKGGFRIARFYGAELIVYAKVRPYIDVDGDFWNNKVKYGPGIRLKPFPQYGLILFADYIFGNYYGIDKEDNPNPQHFEGVEAGAAFWQQWGDLPNETALFWPFTGWREIYGDAIYYQWDRDNIIATLWAKEGFGCVRLGPLTSDLYLRTEALIDLNEDYWNNRVQGSVGIRLRPAELDIELQLSCELIGGYYYDRSGTSEFPEDANRSYVGARVELTYWFGWGF